MKKPVSYLTIFISIIFLMLMITRCKKEYSYEGGPPAVYSLSGAPDACAEIKINGDYYAGVVTDSNNTIQVMVNVTTIGNYNIITSEVDGISFSLSGSFTDTGYQAVTLNCSGTPDTTGTFTFTIPGNNGCYFSITITGQPGADYLLAGSPNECENPVINGEYVTGKDFSASNTVTVNVSVATTGKYVITTDTVNGVSFSAAGSFTATGDQQVILTGSGTPQLPGLIYLNLYAGTSQCSFAIPVRNIEPLATYVLESGFGNPNPCTPHSVQGTYIANTPLTNSNTITIGVYVKELGNYCIATDKINGMQFQATGSFTATGELDVVLYGEGTPIAPGNYTFAPQIVGPAPLGGSSCGIDLTVQ